MGHVSRVWACLCPLKGFRGLLGSPEAMNGRSDMTRVQPRCRCHAASSMGSLEQVPVAVHSSLVPSPAAFAASRPEPASSCGATCGQQTGTSCWG